MDDPREGFGAVAWTAMAWAALVCALLLVCGGCRTAGSADQAARLNLRDVTVTGDLVLSVGSGDRTQETTQSAGKDVGVSGLAAQATDNAVGVGGGTTSKGAGGTATQKGPTK